MIRILRALSVLIALFVATPALAIDTSFHTYDGFAETVDAFRLVSLLNVTEGLLPAEFVCRQRTLLS